MKNKKIFAIPVLAILIIILINPIKKEIYSIQFKKNVKEFLNENYKVINSVEFSGNYDLNIDLNMNSEFNSLNFLEQKPTIKSISNDLKDLYISYRDKVNKIDNNIDYNYGMIKFNVDDFFYNTCFVSNIIHKNGNNALEYTDKDYFIEQIKSKILLFDISLMEKDYIEIYLNEIDNVEKYKYILDIENADTLLLEIAYQYLLKLSINNEYSESIFYYKNKLTNYKDSTELLDKMLEKERNSEKEYLTTPKIGMTKTQVLNTSWGEPLYKDYGGTVADKNNKKRTNGKWDESWYYKRNNNHIWIDFKSGEVVRFKVTLKGELSSKEYLSVDNL